MTECTCNHGALMVLMNVAIGLLLYIVMRGK